MSAVPAGHFSEDWKVGTRRNRARSRPSAATSFFTPSLALFYGTLYTPSMTPPSDIPSDGLPVSPVRQHFLQHLVALAIKPTAHEYYVQWAEAWTKVRGHSSVDATTAFFDALGRSTHIEDWQFRQAVDAVYIPARIFIRCFGPRLH